LRNGEEGPIELREGLSGHEAFATIAVNVVQIAIKCDTLKVSKTCMSWHLF
jgi:hypothetical protein